MISIALVLLLMIGINQVFKVTGEAVGTAQVISTTYRDTRAAQAVINDDFAAAMGDTAPCMLLLSRTQPAFRNRADELSDRDYDPTVGQVLRDRQKLTIDLDRNGTEGEAPTVVPGEQVHPTSYNSRNHRTDIFSFFAQGLFRRQTGGDKTDPMGNPLSGDSPLIADMTTSEAWIWYGHMRLPDGSGIFTTDNDPGEGTFTTNPNNFYSSDWTLGRVAIGLKDKDIDSPTNLGVIKDKNGSEQYFINRTWTYTEPAGGRTNLSPLTYQSQSQQTGSGTFAIQQSRFDLAAVTAKGFRDRLEAVLTDNDPGYPANYDWFTRLFLRQGQRFQCNPFVIKPVSAVTYSQQFPIFLQHCGQFIVEYAGDYVQQDNDPTSSTFGDVINAYFDPMTGLVDPTGTTDGVVDYVVINRGTANQYQQLRWYGLPRDTNGDGRIPGDQSNNNLMPDVVPLRDIVRTASARDYSGVPGAPFEKFTWVNNPPAANRVLQLRLNYAALGTAGMAFTEEYICAWGPSDPKPKLIRIVYTIDDPGGRIAEGQTFESVFRVGG